MVEGRTMQDAYMDVGVRAKQDARAELLSRAMHDSWEGGGTSSGMNEGRRMQDAYMDNGDRVTQELLPSYCRVDSS